MPRRVLDEDDWDDEEEWGGDDDEGFDPPEEVEEGPTVPCPYCEREIPEDTPRCPYCENYISKEDTPPDRKPLWIIIGTLLCLYAIYRWIVG